MVLRGASVVLGVGGSIMVRRYYMVVYARRTVFCSRATKGFEAVGRVVRRDV